MTWLTHIWPDYKATNPEVSQTTLESIDLLIAKSNNNKDFWNANNMKLPFANHKLKPEFTLMPVQMPSTSLDHMEPHITSLCPINFKSNQTLNLKPMF